MHEETGIDLVATNDVHYTMAEDAEPMIFFSVCRQTRSSAMRTECVMRAASIM